MNRTETETELAKVREAMKRMADAQTDMRVSFHSVMRRLIHEAIANRMSAEDVARLSGYTVKRVRDLMRIYDLDPKGGKQMLSRKAAEALANNAELLGIEPSEMDLMSPLAYLPAGSELRKAMAAQGVSQVDPDEFLETDPCGARHPRLTALSSCVKRKGTHDYHEATFADEYGTTATWPVR